MSQQVIKKHVENVLYLLHSVIESFAGGFDLPIVAELFWFVLVGGVSRVDRLVDTSLCPLAQI